MSLFEIESILSINRREKIETQKPTLDLDSLKDKPFDSEGMKVVSLDLSNKAVLKKEELIKKAKESANDIDNSVGAKKSG